MTVIRPNSVSGINSITAQADEIKVFKSNGTQGGLIIGGANLNATSGISTLLALNVTGNVSIAGTLTYQDVTNVDSVGIITARSGIDASGTSIFRGALQAQDNLEIAGEIVHLSDTDTRIQFPSNDTISFKTAGNERLRITSDGNVGINSTNPNTPLEIYTAASAAWKFRINTSVSDGAGFYQRSNGEFEMVLRDASNNNNYIAGTGGDLQFVTSATEKVRITSDGNMGLGLTPAYSGIFGGAQTTFHIGGTAAPCLRITSSTSNQADLVIHAGNSGRRVDIANMTENGSISMWTKPTGGSITQRLKISSDGYVTKPAHPAFFVTMNGGDQTTAAANILPFDTVVHNNGGHFKTSGSDIYNFVCPVAGYYFFGGQVWLKHGAGTGNHARWEIWRDSTIVALAGWHQNGVNLNDMQSSATVTIYCDAGAKVYMEADYALSYWRGSAGSPHTFFHGHLIG